MESFGNVSRNYVPDMHKTPRHLETKDSCSDRRPDQLWYADRSVIESPRVTSRLAN